MKADDFILPQTPKEVYKEKSHIVNVEHNGKIYKVPVIYLNELDDLYAFIHNPQGISGLKGDLSDAVRYAKAASFNDIANKSVICTSYVSKDNICATGSGFIFEVPAENQYAASGHDIGSRSKNLSNMLIEYYIDNGVKADTHDLSERTEYKLDERKMVSKNLKKILNVDNKGYIKIIDNLKDKLAGRTLTFELMEEIDPNLASAYQKFLSRTNYNSMLGNEALMSNNGWNEVIVSNPVAVAFYTTKNIENAPTEMLRISEEEGIPIVIFKQNN